MVEKFIEVGGNFWLKENQWDEKSGTLSNKLFIEKFDDLFYTSSGRGSIRLLLKQKKWENKIALLPYFTCESVIEPFIDEGFKIHFYELNKDFSINKDHLVDLVKKTNPSILYLQSYFGFDTLKDVKAYISGLKNSGDLIVVEDITHNLLNSENFTDAHYYTGSVRKWLEIPDGGILVSNISKIKIEDTKDSESDEIVNLFIKASKFKESYTKTLKSSEKEEYRKLFYKAEAILDHQKDIFPLSEVSKAVLKNADFKLIKKKRSDNYNLLYNALSGITNVNFAFPLSDSNTSPLYFCIICKGFREEIQKELALNSIYAPIIWPKSDYVDGTANALESYFYNDLLSIPCDQRYDEDQIQRITEVLKKYFI